MKAIAVAALTFAMSTLAVGGLAQRATQDQSQQPQPTPRMMQGTGTRMMGGGMGTMRQMGQMMNRHQQMMENMSKLMQSMAAIEAEKDPAALKAKLAEHRALLEQMRSRMMHQGEMMQQLMGCPQPPAASGSAQLAIMAEAKEGCGGFDHTSPNQELYRRNTMATATVLPPAPNQHFFGWVPRTKATAVTRIPVPVCPSSAYTDLSGAFLSANLMGSPSRKRTLTTSIVLHTILIGIPLLLSAWFTETLDLRTYTQTLLVAPPAAAAPSPPPSVATVPKQGRRVFTSRGKLFMPTAIPRQVTMLKEAPLPPEPEGTGVFGGVPGGVTGGVIGGMLDAIRAPEAPPPPPRTLAEKARAPVPVGGNVQPPRIKYRVNPDYPLLAHQAGIQGEVIISATIDSQGNVVDMKVVSGPALLYTAAMKALGQWKFEPTYLDGEPVAIKWNASVRFRIGTSNPAS